MEPLYLYNGLMFWTEHEIAIRDRMIPIFADGIENALRKQNPAWRFVRVEAPLLTPRGLLNPQYRSDDVYEQCIVDLENDELQVQDDGLTLRPETTPGSYVYAEHILNNHSGYQAPLSVWQAGKSFRRETDHVTKNMRLKEFWQQEFQCIYAADSKNDYHAAICSPVRYMLHGVCGLPTRIVPSDRLPSYSQATMDVEVQLGLGTPDERWMELCSISKRTDYPSELKFPGKTGLVTKPALVLEIAIGLDRCVYARTEYLRSIGDVV